MGEIMTINQFLIDGYQKCIQVNNGPLQYSNHSYPNGIDWSLLPTESEGVLASFEWKNGVGKKYIVNNYDDNMPVENSPFTVTSYTDYQAIVNSYIARDNQHTQIVTQEEIDRAARETESDTPDEV